MEYLDGCTLAEILEEARRLSTSWVIAPLTAIMTAQLYLKARQAGGEVLRDAIEQFEALEIPRSRWQARMRTRSGESDTRIYVP
jgi:hypothetical protein